VGCALWHHPVPASVADRSQDLGRRLEYVSRRLPGLRSLFLLPGVALPSVSTSNRFGQIQAEFHRVLDHPDSHAQIAARSLVARARRPRDALASLYASVGLFALGSLLGGVVDLWRPEWL